jgi:putative radical SAM enzyme (TIGR03279 family)
MLKITAVAPESLGAELGLQVGTELLTVNGRDIEDFLDWEFLSADENLLLRVREPDGQEVEYDIERPDGLPMGVAVEPPRIRRCANRCDFCFVDGLPEGLRETLYIRDDDYRLSFKYGNFATLTNLKPHDVERIVEYRLSPLYVSVHATDPVVRRWLLRNPLAPDILEQLRFFAAAGLQFHTQVVLSPGVNDGEVLERTLADLWDLGPAVLSVSVVPVGLTTFSKHHLVREPTREECRAAIRQLESWADRARTERGKSWALGADELYLRADVPLPPTEWYGEFDQVENGVGSVRYLQRCLAEGAEDLGEPCARSFGRGEERGVLEGACGAGPDAVTGPSAKPSARKDPAEEPRPPQQLRRGALAQWRGRRIAVLTGTSMAGLMPQVLEPLGRMTGAHLELIPLVNSLFGTSVTCAGLLPGAAFREALGGRTDLDLALIPAEALNEDQLFMDDLALASLRAAVPVVIRPSYCFTDALSTPLGP